MSILESKRNFGVEIEFVAPNAINLSKIRCCIRTVEDGSLRPLEYAREYVSEILNGISGEKEIARVAGILKSYGASCDSEKTSMHIHLDAKMRNITLISSHKKTKDSRVAISNRLVRELGMGAIKRFIIDNEPASEIFPESVHSTHIDGVCFYSRGKLTRKPLLNYTYYNVKRDDRFKFLRNSLYFYTKFSDVMESIVSNSRRYGNMYCIPLSISYDPDEIAKTSDINELRSLWYKNNNSGLHYDNSRYHNVNFHSVWNRHGTIEIRSHGGTTDPHKILLWVKLHQKILDKLEETSLDDLIKMDDSFDSFLQFIEDDILQEYVKRLRGFFAEHE